MHGLSPTSLEVNKLRNGYSDFFFWGQSGSHSKTISNKQNERKKERYKTRSKSSKKVRMEGEKEERNWQWDGSVGICCKNLTTWVPSQNACKYGRKELTPQTALSPPSMCTAAHIPIHIYHKGSYSHHMTTAANTEIYIIKQCS